MFLLTNNNTQNIMCALPLTYFSIRLREGENLFIEEIAFHGFNKTYD